MKKEQIIIDTDAGVDDTMALLLALRSPEIEIKAITTVHGNAELKDCTRNVLHVLEMTNNRHIPVAQGAEAPMIKKPVYGKYVHGENGIGDFINPNPTISCVDFHAVDYMESLIKGSKEKTITLVALGPLTNIALLIMKNRSLIKKIKRVIFMGGTYLTPGNATPVSSANLFHDPHAARVVYDSGVPIVSVGLDACKKFFFKEEEIEGFSKISPVGKYIYDISHTIYLDFYTNNVLGFRGYQSNDTPSIGYLINPDLYKTVVHHVDIEIAGEFTTAQTVIDYKHTRKNEENVTICTDLDGEALKAIFTERVLH